MRWSDLARLYTPVATPLQRVQPVALVDPEPASGARWGKPSAFSWSSEAARTSPAKQSITNQTSSGTSVEYMRIIPAQAQVASQRVKVRSPSDEDVWIEIDRLTRLLMAAVGDGSSFRRGRDLAAWLGVMPRQHTTGGKPKLLGITKRGNRYLRMLFIHGARAALPSLAKSASPLGGWLPRAACTRPSEHRGRRPGQQACTDRLGDPAR